ncbi:MAG: YbjN domain-containing protein [Cyanobacteria bacterium P01_D01_bin.123]
MVYSEMSTSELNKVEEELESVSNADLVATVISSLKDDVAYENRENGHTWKFNYGTAEVFVHLTGETENDTLTVWSPVLKRPFPNEAGLFESLLAKNWSETLEARFSLWNDQIVLHSSRTLADISPSEISRAITLVATLADETDLTS